VKINRQVAGSPQPKLPGIGKTLNNTDSRLSKWCFWLPTVFQLRVEHSSLELSLHCLNHFRIVSSTSFQNAVHAGHQVGHTRDSIYLHDCSSSLKFGRIRLSFVTQRVQLRGKHQRRGQVLKAGSEDRRYFPVLVGSAYIGNDGGERSTSSEAAGRGTPRNC
jgi:hypothetical protein